MDPNELLGEAQEMVRQGEQIGAEQVEVFLTLQQGISVDIEAGSLQGVQRTSAQTVAVRVVKDGRLGFATSAGRTDRVLDDALRAARYAPSNNYCLPDGVVDQVRLVDDAIAALDVSEVVEVTKQLQDDWQTYAPSSKMTGGGASTSYGASALASSQGTATWSEGTSMSLGASLVSSGDATASLWDSVSRPHWLAGIPEKMEQLGNDLQELVSPSDGPTGNLPVLFSPDAAGELIRGFLSNAVNGDEMMRQASPWANSVGEQVANSGLSVVDDPLLPDTLGYTKFDDEGVAARTTPIIENGVLKTGLFDTWQGHRHGQLSTGHGIRGGAESRPGIGQHYTVITHEKTDSKEALMEQLGNGYYVESLLGAHTLDVTSGAFSVTAPNVWHIEDGARASAAKEIAIASSVPELLRGCLGVSNTPRVGGSQTPHMAFESVAVSR